MDCKTVPYRLQQSGERHVSVCRLFIICNDEFKPVAALSLQNSEGMRREWNSVFQLVLSLHTAIRKRLLGRSVEEGS